MEKGTDTESKEEKMNRQTKKLILGLSVILVISFALIINFSWPLIFGKTMVLETRPIDPFDILRGQYITINYNITSIPVIQDASVGDTVYVSLVKSGDVWVYKSASLDKPKEGDFIKGEILANYGDTLTVKYGIEQYYFERNANLPRNNLTVEVKVSSSGESRISQLLYNNKPVEISYTKPTITS